MRKSLKKRKARKIILIILGVIFGLFLAAATTFFVLYSMGKASLLGYKVDVSVPDEMVDSAQDDGSEVVYKGNETVLKGERAKQYIKWRANDLEANSRRMLCQKQFITAFASQAGNQVLSDFTKLTALYNAVISYTFSDMILSEITYLASCCLISAVLNTFYIKNKIKAV